MLIKLYKTGDMIVRILFWGGAAVFIATLLYAGWCRLQPRRVFYLFAAIILICTAVIFSFWNGQKQNTATEQQRMQILSEQSFFITWYENYKHSVEDIDRVWTKYNSIIEDFSDKKISPAKLQQELMKNQKEALQLQEEIKNALPPQELSDNNYKLCYNVLEKTREYLAVQIDTINKTVQFVSMPDFQAKQPQEQRQGIDNIRILSAPANLNIASEISAVRDSLNLPDL